MLLSENISNLNISDIRICKTKLAIYKALISMLKTYSLYSIKVTDLCKNAYINRKTFYNHYTSVTDVFSELEDSVIDRYLNILVERRAIGKNIFKASEIILITNEIVEENLDDFNILFSYFRNGDFTKKLGSKLGTLSLDYSSQIVEHNDVMIYCYSFVFAISGFVTSYFDWVEFGRQIPIEDLAWSARSLFDNSLASILDKE